MYCNTANYVPKNIVVIHNRYEAIISIRVPTDKNLDNFKLTVPPENYVVFLTPPRKPKNTSNQNNHGKKTIY